MKSKFYSAALVAFSLLAYHAFTQGPPQPRLHKITKKGDLKLVPADTSPPAASEVTIEIIGEQRVITANGIPNHKTGRFPNPGNPNPITVQSHVFKVPAKPVRAEQIRPMRGNFGVAINGVPFDPGAGEFYDGEPGWQYEPLSGAINLGVDLSHAHVQPTGKYHYHGLPTALMDQVKIDPAKHSPLIGWAADGFPIYAVYGLSDPQKAAAGIKKLTSSYQLKKGDRPGGQAPSGPYDGTFVADYEYVAGSGDLDECNGRQTMTPEFPAGTYAYYLTENWPVVPRNYRGTPSADFRHGAPGTGEGQLSNGPGPTRPSGPRGTGEPGPETSGGRPRAGQLMPPRLQETLQLSEAQIKKLADLQKTVDTGLAEIFTPEQLEKLNAFRHGPPGFPPGPGPR